MGSMDFDGPSANTAPEQSSGPELNPDAQIEGQDIETGGYPSPDQKEGILEAEGPNQAGDDQFEATTADGTTPGTDAADQTASPAGDGAEQANSTDSPNQEEATAAQEAKQAQQYEIELAQWHNKEIARLKKLLSSYYMGDITPISDVRNALEHIQDVFGKDPGESGEFKDPDTVAEQAEDMAAIQEQLESVAAELELAAEGAEEPATAGK